MITRATQITSLIAFLFLFSCSTVQEEAIEPTEQTNDNSILLQLANTSWTLDDCPSASSINIDGYSECDYLNYISFTDHTIFIRHGSNSFFTEHNICFVDGSNMVISRQGCSFTNWTGVVELEIINFDNDNIEIYVRFPNINPGYNERFVYDNA